jgi:hypothetical protein
MAAGRRINRKVADDEGSTDGSELSEYEFEVEVEELPASSDNDAGNTEPDEDAHIGYADTKAMADADREVSLLSFLQK